MLSQADGFGNRDALSPNPNWGLARIVRDLPVPDAEALSDLIDVPPFDMRPFRILLDSARKQGCYSGRATTEVLDAVARWADGEHPPLGRLKNVAKWASVQAWIKDDLYPQTLREGTYARYDRDVLVWTLRSGWDQPVTALASTWGEVLAAFAADDSCPQRVWVEWATQRADAERGIVRARMRLRATVVMSAVALLVVAVMLTLLLTASVSFYGAFISSMVTGLLVAVAGYLWAGVRYR